MPKPIISAVLVGLLTACGGSASPSDGADAAPIDAPTVDGSVTPDAGACGVRSGLRGLTHRDVTIDGLHRTYLVYLPADLDPTMPVPLVTVFHGYTMSGQTMVDLTSYQGLADREHIAVAFPDGQGGPSSAGAPWNVGGSAAVCPSYAGAPPNATGDDFKFLDAIQADVTQDQCVDGAHRFVTGFSMGGYFAHHAGCMRPDLAGVAPHSGGTHDLAACPSTKKPIILFHGLADNIVPAGCEDPSSVAVPGHEPAATAWAEHNGCSATTHQVTVQGGHCEVYDGCPAGGQVELCTFTAMGHCWAGGPQSLYGCPTYASATQLEWDFWKQYAW